MTWRCRRWPSSPRSSRCTGSHRTTIPSSSSQQSRCSPPPTLRPPVQTDDVAGIVLAAGAGRRLRPLTTIRPKPLCPVANVPLIELAFGEVGQLVGDIAPVRVAVNVHHLADQVIEWVGPRAYISREEPVALGT